ncbi:MAG: T9SS type A sorting domain-containing protein [Saprospiraceae bacterium]|nr:T9SS type A sorting domain-containing protein [Saprospiraceae bacterium]
MNCRIITTIIVAAVIATTPFDSLISQTPSPNCGLNQLITQCNLAGITGNCPPVSTDFFEDNCIGNVNKYLAKSIIMFDMVKENTNANDDNAQCCGEYQNCAGGVIFCPQRYCQELSLIRELKPTFIARAAQLVGGELGWIADPNAWDGLLYGQQGYWEAIHQLVCDINAIYDCDETHRPIIQAAILESIDDAVRFVPIPNRVMDRFNATGPIYPRWNGSAATLPQTFNVDRIRFTAGNHTTAPDITRLEARMWFYYCAQVYIDAGFTAIHLGDINVWARNELDPNSPNYLQRTTELVTMIREYAAQQGTFVLLNVENGPFGDITIPGTNRLLFDFNAAPMRPREVLANVVNDLTTGRVDNAFCQDPSYKDQSFFINSPCAEDDYPAGIDLCHTPYPHYATGGKVSPLGCIYESTPTVIYWDFEGNGRYNVGDYFNLGYTQVGNYFFPPNINNRSHESVWGWNDNSWFGWQVSPQCQLSWLEYYLCKFRNEISPFSESLFLQIPGRLVDGSPRLNTPAAPNGRIWRLSQNNLLIDAIQDVFRPTRPNIVYEAYCYPKEYRRCSGRPIVGEEKSNEYNYGPIGYKFYVNKIGDCSSIYSFHIKNPDGSWQDYTFGKERWFFPPNDGVYTIYIRQDNFELPSPYSFIDSLSLFLYSKDCCNNDYNQEKKFNPDDNFTNTSKNKPNTYIDNNEQEWIAYPNPTSSLLTIKNNSNSTAQVTILLLDMHSTCLERISHKNGLTAYDIDISSLPSGCYILKIVSDNKEFSKRIIKI